MSFDASDKMLKYALKTRWERRKEKAFDAWGNISCLHMSNVIIKICLYDLMYGMFCNSLFFHVYTL